MEIEQKVDKLKKETIALRKEMVIMKTLMKQQNMLIKVLLENTQADEAYIHSLANKKKWFPIKTQQELDEFENTVDHTNRDEVVYQARLCMRGSALSETLEKFLDEELVMNYNLEGTYNKRRFLDYENFLDVLYRVTQADGWDHEKFLAEFRKGMRKIKVRQLKKNERNRKKRKLNVTKSNGFKENDARNNDTEENDDEDDDDDNDNDDADYENE